LDVKVGALSDGLSNLYIQSSKMIAHHTIDDGMMVDELYLVFWLPSKLRSPSNRPPYIVWFYGPALHMDRIVYGIAIGHQ